MSQNPQIMQHRQELDRLIYRRGDLSTMRDDVAAQLEAIDREHGQVVGAIAATRTRIAVLEEEARRGGAGPKLVPEVVPAESVPVPAAKK